MLTDLFAASFKILCKKHKNARPDVVTLLEYVERYPGAGDAIPGYGGCIYKVRGELKSESIGKRGGLRLIYYYEPPYLLMLYIYSKKMMDNPPSEMLMKWLKDNPIPIPDQ